MAPKRTRSSDVGAGAEQGPGKRRHSSAAGGPARADSPALRTRSRTPSPAPPPLSAAQPPPHNGALPAPRAPSPARARVLAVPLPLRAAAPHGSSSGGGGGGRAAALGGMLDAAAAAATSVRDAAAVAAQGGGAAAAWTAAAAAAPAAAVQVIAAAAEVVVSPAAAVGRSGVRASTPVAAPPPAGAVTARQVVSNGGSAGAGGAQRLGVQQAAAAARAQASLAEPAKAVAAAAAAQQQRQLRQPAEAGAGARALPPPHPAAAAAAGGGGGGSAQPPLQPQLRRRIRRPSRAAQEEVNLSSRATTAAAAAARLRSWPGGAAPPLLERAVALAQRSALALLTGLCALTAAAIAGSAIMRATARAPPPPAAEQAQLQPLLAHFSQHPKLVQAVAALRAQADHLAELEEERANITDRVARMRGALHDDAQLLAALAEPEERATAAADETRIAPEDADIAIEALRAELESMSKVAQGARNSTREALLTAAAHTSGGLSRLASQLGRLSMDAGPVAALRTWQQAIEATGQDVEDAANSIADQWAASASKVTRARLTELAAAGESTAVMLQRADAEQVARVAAAARSAAAAAVADHAAAAATALASEPPPAPSGLATWQSVEAAITHHKDLAAAAAAKGPDVAALRAGAHIVRGGGLTSPDFADSGDAPLLDWALHALQYPGHELGAPAEAVLSEGAGGASDKRCWAVRGDSGSVTVRLARPTAPEAIAIEHSALALRVARGHAPNDIRVDGWETDPLSPHARPAVLLEGAHFDARGPPQQTFPLTPPQPGRAYTHVTLYFDSNHGAHDYTCLYRLHVYGAAAAAAAAQHGGGAGDDAYDAADAWGTDEGAEEEEDED